MEKILNTYSHYPDIGKLFLYPDKNTAELAARCLGLATDAYPDAVADLNRFAKFVMTHNAERIEEIYTRTFHIQAICYLDLGYVIFGEDYKRGEFLVNMKREQNEAENDCGDELPDNLTNVLSLLPLLSDTDFRDELVVKILVPAVKKMLSEFDSSRMEMKKKALQKKHRALIQEDEEHINIYEYLLRGLLAVLQSDFAQALLVKQEHEPRPAFGAAFLSNCGSCATPQTNNLQSHEA